LKFPASANCLPVALEKVIVITPTQAPLEVTEALLGQTTIVLEEDGSFSRTTVFEVGDAEVSSGTWELTGENTMTVIESYYDEFEGGYVTDTLDITFSLDTDELTFTFSEVCAEEECLEGFEFLFGLETGSLI